MGEESGRIHRFRGHLQLAACVIFIAIVGILHCRFDIDILTRKKVTGKQKILLIRSTVPVAAQTAVRIFVKKAFCVYIADCLEHIFSVFWSGKMKPDSVRELKILTINVKYIRCIDLNCRFKCICRHIQNRNRNSCCTDCQCCKKRNGALMTALHGILLP